MGKHLSFTLKDLIERNEISLRVSSLHIRCASCNSILRILVCSQLTSISTTKLLLLSSCFQNVWCTSKYYGKSLVQFPVSKEGSCDAEIDDLDEFISQYELKLAEARESIRKEMLENKPSYFEQIDNIQAEYLATFESYLKNCYDEDSDEYKNAVAESQEKLFVARQKAEENFETPVNNAITRIVCFHDRLIASFRSCLESRSSRITKYNADIDAKALEIKEKYAKKLEDIIVKRVEWADKVFKK